ncbi:hypothetical protein Cpir12675_001496 [Ceratocystis pirilliformis]|uniref:NAD(P)-binding protein n=1 Tax=Ceratocystis pirilliformis TaxID=259994 RepID=A0ABR3ZF36_9PEZI
MAIPLSLLLAFASIGIIASIKWVYSLIRFIELHFLHTRHPLAVYQRSRRPAYALITGASAGIGLGTATALAHQGFGVILIGHLPDELALAKDFIRAQVRGAKVETVVLNAITASSSSVQKLASDLFAKDFAISVIINNVGGMPISNTPFRPFSTYLASDIDRVIDMNARFMAQLTVNMIPLLNAHRSSPLERSLVLSLTSAAAVGLPYLTMYSATKAFDLGLACGLAREFEMVPETAHIDSLAVMPGEVRSQGNCLGVPKGAPKWYSYGCLIVKTVDVAVRQGRRILVPYWLHHVQIRAMDYIPEKLLTREVAKTAILKRDEFNARHEQTRSTEMK